VEGEKEGQGDKKNTRPLPELMKKKREYGGFEKGMKTAYQFGKVSL